MTTSDAVHNAMAAMLDGIRASMTPECAAANTARYEAAMARAGIAGTQHWFDAASGYVFGLCPHGNSYCASASGQRMTSCQGGGRCENGTVEASVCTMRSLHLDFPKAIRLA